jgi:hypothetical protein
MLTPPILNQQTSRVPPKNGNAGEELIVEDRSHFRSLGARQPACYGARARGGSAHSGMVDVPCDRGCRSGMARVHSRLMVPDTRRTNPVQAIESTGRARLCFGTSSCRCRWETRLTPRPVGEAKTDRRGPAHSRCSAPESPHSGVGAKGTSGGTAGISRACWTNRFHGRHRDCPALPGRPASRVGTAQQEPCRPTEAGSYCRTWGLRVGMTWVISIRIGP